jgi:hypothetical protein
MPCSMAEVSFAEGIIDMGCALVDTAVTVASSLNRVSSSKDTFAFSSTDELWAVKGRKLCSSVSCVSSSVDGRGTEFGKRRSRRS